MLRLVISLLCLVCALSGQPGVARAGEVRAELSIDGRAWLLSAELDSPLSARLEDAATKGVPLHFVLEFELIRPRWYWWDQRVAQHAVQWRLSYHALTREYRVVREDGQAQGFDTLEAALGSLAQIRNWRVEPAEGLSAGTYVGLLRLRLDVAQLPKPFRIDALTNREWNPQVEWTRFNLTFPTATSAQ